MKQKELTKTFMTISNWKKTLVSMVYTEIFQGQRSRVNSQVFLDIYDDFKLGKSPLVSMVYTK